MKAFVYGTLSGIVEPIAAIITILLSRFIQPALPYLLALAAGAMLYVGGIDSGIGGGRTFQYRDHWICIGIHGHDDFGCGTRII